MSVELRSLPSKGDLGKERLTLRVTSATDIGQYVLFRADFQEGVVTNHVYNTFWFPDLEVARGDLIVIYTKAGTQSSRVLDGGNTAHFFYLGLKEAIWDRSDVAPVLLKIQEWEFKSAQDL